MIVPQESVMVKESPFEVARYLARRELHIQLGLLQRKAAEARQKKQGQAKQA